MKELRVPIAVVNDKEVTLSERELTLKFLIGTILMELDYLSRTDKKGDFLARMGLAVVAYLGRDPDCLAPLQEVIEYATDVQYGAVVSVEDGVLDIEPPTLEATEEAEKVLALKRMVSQDETPETKEPEPKVEPKGPDEIAPDGGGLYERKKP